MKSRILNILRNTGGYVSGQQLCEQFGVSRTAIWKSINQLKKEGYEIEAVSNKGYHIVHCPDVISAEEVQSRLETTWAGQKLFYYRSIDSTNTCAKRLAEEGAAEGTLVLADEQTAGKGRRGRAWETPEGSAIAMSLLLRPFIRPEKASMLTLLMGMAMVKTCRELYDLPCHIKWPNDVVIDGRKVCGILTEMSTEINEIHYVVIGTGINVNMKYFPEELQDKAISIAMALGHEVKRAEIVAEAMKHFERYYELFLEKQDLTKVLDEYNEMLISIGKCVRVLEPGNEYEADCEGINAQGELLVRMANGTQKQVYAGEVSVRGIYGYV